MFVKLVGFTLAIIGAVSAEYLGYNGLGNEYQAAYAPHYNNYKPKDYKFEYGVSDPHTGDHKSQWETKENGVVRGAYSLLEPDGTTRVVEYIADEGGFRAVVKKLGHPIETHPATPVVIAEPTPLVHNVALYDGSSGVYGGQRENYLQAYQPQQVVYNDNSAEVSDEGSYEDNNSSEEVSNEDEGGYDFHNYGSEESGEDSSEEVVGYNDYEAAPVSYVQPEVSYAQEKAHQVIAAPVYVQHVEKQPQVYYVKKQPEAVQHNVHPQPLEYQPQISYENVAQHNVHIQPLSKQVVYQPQYSQANLGEYNQHKIYPQTSQAVEYQPHIPQGKVAEYSQHNIHPQPLQYQAQISQGKVAQYSQPELSQSLEYQPQISYATNLRESHPQQLNNEVLHQAHTPYAKGVEYSQYNLHPQPLPQVAQYEKSYIAQPAHGYFKEASPIPYKYLADYRQQPLAVEGYGHGGY